MNHIDQIITANEELTLAIESYGLAVKPIAIGGISLALEEAQEDVKQEAKQGVLAKIKSLIARVIAWFKNLLFKKKEDKFTAPVYDSEKFKKDMEENLRRSTEQMRERMSKMNKDLDETLKAANNINSQAYQDKLRKDIAAGVERRRQEQAAQVNKEAPGSVKTKAHWKKFIEPNLAKYLQDSVRHKCGLLTALAKGGEISKDTVRFEDITAPIREMDNSLYALIENVQDTAHEVLRNLNEHKRIEGFVKEITETTNLVTSFATKLEALGKVEPIAPNIDSSSINTIYRVVYDLSGRMPRSSIASSVDILTKEMETLQKAVDSVKSVDGMESNESFKAIQDLITKVIVPATAQAQKCARIVSEVFYNFQEIGGLISKHARDPKGINGYDLFSQALGAEFNIWDDVQLARIVRDACEIHGTNYLYPEQSNG